MNLFQEFHKECYDRKVIENDKGYILYNVYEDKSLYIHQAYTLPEFRTENVAGNLEDQLIEKYNAKSVYLYVDLGAKNPELSIKAVLGRKYKIYQTTNEKMVFCKEL